MRRTTVLCFSVAIALGATACSSGSSSSSSTSASSPSSGAVTTVGSTPVTSSGDPSTDRQAVVDFTVSRAAVVGYTLDPTCVTGVVAKLTDADAALLAKSTLDTAPDATAPVLSAEGEALGNSVLDCAIGSQDTALVAAAAAKVLGSPGGNTLDADCVRTNMARLSDDQLNFYLGAETDSTDPRLQTIGFSLFDCLPTGSTPTS
jgi:hypothetical protein